MQSLDSHMFQSGEQRAGSFWEGDQEERDEKTEVKQGACVCACARVPSPNHLNPLMSSETETDTPSVQNGQPQQEPPTLCLDLSQKKQVSSFTGIWQTVRAESGRSLHAQNRTWNQNFEHLMPSKLLTLASLQCYDSNGFFCHFSPGLLNRWACDDDAAFSAASLLHRLTSEKINPHHGGFRLT